MHSMGTNGKKVQTSVDAGGTGSIVIALILVFLRNIGAREAFATNGMLCDLADFLLSSADYVPYGEAYFSCCNAGT